MTIVQLEYAVAVDTYRSFVLAAQKCFVTQPTLSMQVQKLEEQLGVKLFDRTHQPIVPTQIGIEIIEQARKIISESHKIKEIINNKTNEVSGELKLGIIPTIAPYLLPKVLGLFLHKYPKVTLTITELHTDAIIQQLKLGMLDCGILATPLAQPSLVETPLYYENFVTYLSKASPLFKKKALIPADLNDDQLWLLNEGHCMRNQILNLCKHKQNNNKQLEYNSGSVETLIRMVDVNNGITILPELCLQDFSTQKLDKIRYFKTPEPSREISLVTHQNFVKKRIITALKEEILETISKRMKSKKKKEIVDIGI
jgi:LysR family hydrogen peroxide-inducible transcriptional activator